VHEHEQTGLLKMRLAALFFYQKVLSKEADAILADPTMAIFMANSSQD
tara:strand:+ start:587 stop:730 length:144 start_codon:yes stop_codon:yes gene_type:complete